MLQHNIIGEIGRYTFLLGSLVGRRGYRTPLGNIVLIGVIRSGKNT